MRLGRPFGLLFAATLLGAPACKKSNPQPVVEAKADAAEVPEAPVPAPDGIVAEAVLKAPDASLASLRSISLLIPDKAGSLFADLLHVPKDVARQIDGKKPACFVAIRRAEATVFALSLAVEDPQKAIAALAAGPFKRSDDAELGAVIFEGTSRPKNQVIAVRRGFLVAASSLDALKALAPYATRTMPQRPPPAEDLVVTIPQAAMRGALQEVWRGAIDASAQRRKETLERAKKAGTAGAGGAPLAVMELASEWLLAQKERSLRWLADAGDARIAIALDKGALGLRAEVAVPDAASPLGKSLSAWSTFDASALLRLPASTVLGFRWTDAAAERAIASTQALDLLAAAFPKDLGKPGRDKIEKFLAGWDAARGDALTGAIVYQDLAHAGLTLRLSAKDAKGATAMLEDALTAILALDGIHAELAAADIAPPSFGKATIGGVEARVLTIPVPRKKGEPLAPGAPEAAEIVWGATPAVDGSSDVLLVAATGARELFALALEGAPDKTLAASTELSATTTKLGAGLAAAVIAFPSRVLPMTKRAPMSPPPPPTDGVSLTLGHSATGGFLALDVRKPALEALARWALMQSLKP